MNIIHFGWTFVHAVLFEFIIFIPSIFFVKKLFPYYQQAKQKWSAILYCLLASITVYLLAFYSLTFLISTLPAHIENTGDDILYQIDKNRLYLELNPFQFISRIAWIALSFLLVIPINQLMDSNAKYLANKKKFKDIQLNLLQQRLTPHYLFNELNNIYSLSALNDPNFKKYISHFELFFNLIKDGKQKAVVDMNSELQLMRDYLDFQRIRLRDNVSIVLEFEEAPATISILSLSYFILIENAVKHCNYESEDIGHIFTSYKYLDGRSIFFVKNSTLNHNNTPSGKGLSYLTERVNKYYSDDYQLTSKIKDSFYETTLIINHK